MVERSKGNDVQKHVFLYLLSANYSLTGYYTWENIPTIRSTFGHGVICSTLLRFLNGKMVHSFPEYYAPYFPTLMPCLLWTGRWSVSPLSIRLMMILHDNKEEYFVKLLINLNHI